jgi:predicted transcriptional regulator
MKPARCAKRSRNQIILAILGLLSKGDCTKTSIVYGINLNFQAANRYLETLVEKRLIVWCETSGLWKITPAGEDCRRLLQKHLNAIEAVL